MAFHHSEQLLYFLEIVKGKKGAPLKRKCEKKENGVSVKLKAVTLKI